jgi:hypothetical protein
MVTCKIESFYKAHFPKTICIIAAELFDVIPVVSSLRLTEIEGVHPRDTWEFGTRVNIICGESGSGKTRVLEALKQGAGAPPDLTAPRTGDFSLMSCGQTISALAEILLAAQPAGGCLLMDGVLSYLDPCHKRRLFGLLRKHPGQTIMTVSPSLLETASALCAGMDISTFNLTMPNQIRHV